MRAKRDKPIDTTNFDEAMQTLYAELVEGNQGQALKFGDLERVLQAQEGGGNRKQLLLGMLRAQSMPAKPGTFQSQASLRAAADRVPKRSRVEPEEVIRFRGQLDDVIIEQDPAKETLARFYRTIRTGLMDKPLIMLEVGPPGVGKTLASAALGHAIHDDQDAVLFIDCAGLTNETMLGKYVGIGPGFVGYDDDTLFSQANIQRLFKGKQPVIIHIDEPDKMPQHIATLFWGAINRFLETGKLELGNGDVIDVGPCIVSIASNAGADSAPNGAGPEVLREHYEKAGAASLAQHTNSRIDAIIPFQNLSPEGRVKIAGLEVNKIFRKAQDKALKDTGKVVGLDVHPDVCDLLANLASSDKLGVRPIKSAVQQLFTVIVSDEVGAAEDEARLELVLEPDLDPNWIKSTKSDFEANDGKCPANLTPDDFPVYMRLKNPPPKIFDYQGEIPASDYAQMSPWGSGVCGGRGFLFMNNGELGSQNELLFLKPGSTEAADKMKPVELPEGLANANLSSYAVTIDEPSDVTDPAKRNNRILMVGVNVPDGGEDVEQSAYIYDATNRAQPFTEIPPPPVPLYGASMGSVDGKVMLFGGRFAEAQVDESALIENQAYVFDTKTQEWEALDAAPRRGRAGTSIVKIDIDGQPKLALVGGEEIARTAQQATYSRSSKDVDVWDPKTGQFESAWQLPVGLAWARARVDDFGRIRVSGGKELLNHGFNEAVSDAVWSLDPGLKEPQWKPREGLGTPGDSLVVIPHSRGGVVTGPFYTDEGTAWKIEKPPVMS